MVTICCNVLRSNLKSPEECKYLKGIVKSPRAAGNARVACTYGEVVSKLREQSQTFAMLLRAL